MKLEIIVFNSIITLKGSDFRIELCLKISEEILRTLRSYDVSDTPIESVSDHQEKYVIADATDTWNWRCPNIRVNQIEWF